VRKLQTSGTFGPYPQLNDVNSILAEIDEKYDLRAKSFIARYGGGTKHEYNLLFDRIMSEVFDGKDNEQGAMISSLAEYGEPPCFLVANTTIAEMSLQLAKAVRRQRMPLFMSCSFEMAW
jgi:hypothetical protein